MQQQLRDADSLSTTMQAALRESTDLLMRTRDTHVLIGHQAEQFAALDYLKRKSAVLESALHGQTPSGTYVVSGEQPANTQKRVDFQLQSAMGMPQMQAPTAAQQRTLNPPEPSSEYLTVTDVFIPDGAGMTLPFARTASNKEEPHHSPQRQRPSPLRPTSIEKKPYHSCGAIF